MLDEVLSSSRLSIWLEEIQRISGILKKLGLTALSEIFNQKTEEIG